MNWLALDIGGANLKAANGLGFAASRPFPLWETPRHLADALRSLVAEAPPSDHLAATMTGELADCFATKADGVRFIVEAFVQACSGRHARVYLVDGRIVAPPVALRNTALAAASNWHALARFAGRFASQGLALLFDVGSTTCDIIPLVDGRPHAQGKTDTERLMSGELVYTGVERSPICAVTPFFPWRGQNYPVAQELFATTWDAYLMLGDLPEQPESTHTADGRSATRAEARDRLARMICADRETFTADDARTAAAHVAERQQELIAQGVAKVFSRFQEPPKSVVLSGQGEFLGRAVLEQLGWSGRIVSLQQELGEHLSRCAPAHALAVLAREAK